MNMSQEANSEALADARTITKITTTDSGEEIREALPVDRVDVVGAEKNIAYIYFGFNQSQTFEKAQNGEAVSQGYELSFNPFFVPSPIPQDDTSDSVKREAEIKKAEAELKARDIELDKRDIEADKKEVELKEEEIALNQREVELDKQEIGLEEREVKLEEKDLVSPNQENTQPEPDTSNEENLG